MLVRCVAVLVAAVGFLTEVPLKIREKLQTTNETHGFFIQTKSLGDGTKYVSRGRFKIRPNKDFEWRTLEPFNTLFYSTQKEYCYSNEDECVTKPISELKGFSNFSAVEKGDYDIFFKAFNAKYEEDKDGLFHILAKPKDSKLSNFLSRVEADGTISNWTLKATFPNKTTFEIQLIDDK